MGKKTRREGRLTRHRRVRRKIRGSAECPRLSVYRSLRHISGQVIDDESGTTLVSVTTTSNQIRKDLGNTSSCEAAGQIGKILGERMKDAGITQAVFDRGGFLYHGRLAALADGVREAGIKI